MHYHGDQNTHSTYAYKHTYVDDETVNHTWEIYVPYMHAYMSIDQCKITQICGGRRAL